MLFYDNIHLKDLSLSLKKFSRLIRKEEDIPEAHLCVLKALMCFGKPSHAYFMHSRASFQRDVS